MATMELVKGICSLTFEDEVEPTPTTWTIRDKVSMEWTKEGEPLLTYYDCALWPRYGGTRTYGLKITCANKDHRSRIGLKPGDEFVNFELVLDGMGQAQGKQSTLNIDRVIVMEVSGSVTSAGNEPEEGPLVFAAVLEIDDTDDTIPYTWTMEA